uniref:Interleukin-11 n=1 Tax=Knipowitschia caucasica TaxID=637954 RepID=A0AAV2K7N4_KNICA
MRIFPDLTSCLVLLLLLDLIGLSSSRPAHTPSLCSLIGSMVPHFDRLINLSKKLQELSDEDLSLIAAAEHRLDSLLEIPHTAAAFTQPLKVNEPISQLYNLSESYKLHMDWLKTARENMSLSSQPAEGASHHLLKLTHLLNSSLHQLQEEVPQAAPPSLPPVSTAFDALRFSVEVSEKLRVFVLFAKRWIRVLQKLSCPRR